MLSDLGLTASEQAVYEWLVPRGPVSPAEVVPDGPYWTISGSPARSL